MSRHHQTPFQKKRRRILYEMHPYCFWCGVLLDPSWTFPNRYAATADHVYPRQVKPVRGDVPGGEITVLACYECNAYRNRAQQAGKLLIPTAPGENVGYDESSAALCAIVTL